MNKEQHFLPEDTIPREWQIGLPTDASNIRPTIIDRENNLLAFEYTFEDKNRIDYYKECLFTSGGTLVASKNERSDGSYISITLHGDNRVNYFLAPSNGFLEVSFPIPKDIFYGDPGNYAYARFASSSSDQPFIAEEVVLTSAFDFRTKKGQVRPIPDDFVFEVPYLQLKRQIPTYYSPDTIPQDWEVSMDAKPWYLDVEPWLFTEEEIDNMGFIAYERDQESNIDFTDSQGNPAYSVDWEVREDAKRGSMLQLHQRKVVKEGEGVKEIARKTIVAPLCISPQALEGALSKRPPYGTKEIFSGVEILDIPWLDIPDIVGVRILREKDPKH